MALKPETPGVLDVTLIRPTHKLSVKTDPEGATISIGGRRAGTSPTVVQVMGFSGIDVTVSKPGYLPVTRRVYSKQANDSLVVPLKRSKNFKW